MFTNYSSIRFAGEPYLPLAQPVQTLPPLKMKPRQSSSSKVGNKPKVRRSSSQSTVAHSGSFAAPTVASKSKSRLTAQSKSSMNNAIRDSQSIHKKHSHSNNNNKKKAQLPPPKVIPIRGDAIVSQLDISQRPSTTGFLDQNANLSNNIEPFDEQISQDIALAVAIIVAEHEMLKRKYPDRYDVPKKKSKSSKSKGSVDPTTTPTPQVAGPAPAQVNTGDKKGTGAVGDPQQQPTPEATTGSQDKKEAVIRATATTVPSQQPPLKNETVSSQPTSQSAAAPPPAPEAMPSQKSANAEKSSSKVEIKNIAASAVVATQPPPPQPQHHQQARKQESVMAIPKKKESSVTFAASSTRTASTILPPTTASAGTVSLSTTIASSQHHHTAAVTNPPLPTLGAKMGAQMEVLKYLNRIQNYMNHLGYQRMGEPEIKINSRLSMKMQMVTAREIIQAGLPIKCLHAVVLAVHFTNCIDTVERFPIYFRSHVGGREYKHIVLGIYVQGHFGALGISRDGGLQDKPTTYSKLSDLIFEYAKCYGTSGHILNDIKFGIIITHDPHSLERLFNKSFTVPIAGNLHSDIEKNVEKFAKQLRAKMGLACLKSHLSNHPSSSSNQSRISRSKTSLSGSVGTVGSGSIAGSERSSTTVRVRALSMGPLLANRTSSSSSSSKYDEPIKKSSKTTVARSKPAKSSKRNK